LSSVSNSSTNVTFTPLTNKKRKRKNNQPQFSCSECSYTTDKARAYIEHRQIIHKNNDRKIYVCHYCPERFSFRPKLFRHIEDIHNIKPEEKTFICEICSKAYLKQNHLQLHYEECHTPSIHICQVENCNQKFTRRFSLNRHMLSAHSDIPKYSCERCKKTFKTYDSWKYHNNVVHKNILMYCWKCGFGFRQKTKLEYHIAQNICRNAKIPCSYCPRKFTTNVGLVTHMKNIHKF